MNKVLRILTNIKRLVALEGLSFCDVIHPFTFSID